MKRLLALLTLFALVNNINAYDFAVKNADGITIYYNYINSGKEVEVTYEAHYKAWDSKKLEYYYYYGGYRYYSSDNIVIPETVTYNERTFPVTQIGSYAFRDSHVYTVILPNSIKNLGSSVFQDSNIKEITIPEGFTEIRSFTFEGCTSLKKVTFPEGLKVIDSYAFRGCTSLTTVTIPESVTVLRGFTKCTGLKSITIPKNVTDVDFNGCDNLIKIYSYIENPVDINSYSPFSETTCYTGTLYVPKGTIEKYKSKKGWSSINYIVEMSGSDDKKCATPTLSYSNKELKYACDTNGATIHETIKCSDAASTTFTGSHKLNAVYEISAYATADGYSQSETITAKLFWVDGSLESSNISGVRANARGILVQSDGDFLTVSGLTENEQVILYEISGTRLDAAKSVNGTATFTIKKTGKVVVVKIGNDAIKVQL